MTDYEFTMPWPPSVNGYWKCWRGRAIVSPRGRQYRKMAIEALGESGLKDEGVNSRLSVSLVLNPPTRRAYDIDNFCKGLFDALTHGGFWADDELVDRLSISKGSVIKDGRVGIKVKLTGRIC